MNRFGVTVDENTLSLHDYETDTIYQYHLACVEPNPKIDAKIRYELTESEQTKINNYYKREGRK